MLTTIRQFLLLLVTLPLMFLLFAPIQPVYALELFGVESSDEVSNIYAGSVENLNNWPLEVISAMEHMQTKLLHQAKGKRNWIMDREIHGVIEKIEETKPKKPRGFFLRLGDAFVQIGRTIVDMGKWVGSIIGLGTKETLFTADAWVYGPQDCDYPLGKDTVRIMSDRLDIEGVLTDPANPTLRLEYEFIAHMSLSFWECFPDAVITNPFPQTTIDWVLLGTYDPVVLGRLFDGAFRNNLTFDYQTKNSTKEEQTSTQRDRNEKMSQKRNNNVPTKSTQPATPIALSGCELSDPIGDSVNERTGARGNEPGVDLTTAIIINDNNTLTINIQTAGSTPPLLPNSSIAYEIGFDTGTGSENPIFYRPGVDVVFIVDVINTTINSFKETKGGVQSDWTLHSVEKQANGITFTLSLSDIGHSTVPPFKIFTSYAAGDIEELDFMPNSGLATCQ